MFNHPLVSICIPTFNGEEHIAEAIKSALSQTYGNIEIIVSDDNSTDKTLEIINSFKQKTTIPIYTYNHQPQGIGANWNYSVTKAKGEYIKFLFQDDIIDNNCIEELLKPFLTNSKVGLSFCKRRFLIEENTEGETDEWINKFSDLHLAWSKIQYIQKGKELLKDQTFLSSPRNKVGEPTAVLLAKKVFDKVGYFRTDLKQSLDYEFWYRVFAKYHVGFIDKTLISFRLHDNQTSAINSKTTINDYELYPLIIYKNIFRHLHPVLKKQLFLKYNIWGKTFRKLKNKCNQYTQS